MLTEQVSFVIQAQSGDIAAQGELFAQYHNQVYFFALSQVKSRADAEDVVQDTFIEVFANVHTLKEPAAFKVWLYTIASRQCVKLFRKQGKATQGYDDISEVAELLPDDGPQPDSVLNTDETRKAIQCLIAELPEPQKAAVLLYYFEELPIADIAKILDVPEGTVKSRLNTARIAMKVKIENSRKRGTPIVAIVPFPLLVSILREMADANAMSPQAAQTALSASTGAIGVGTITATGTSMKTGIAAATKVIIGVLAGVVITGSIVAGIVLSGNKPQDIEPTPMSAIEATTNMQEPIPDIPSETETVETAPSWRDAAKSFIIDIVNEKAMPEAQEQVIWISEGHGEGKYSLLSGSDEGFDPSRMTIYGEPLYFEFGIVPSDQTIESFLDNNENYLREMLNQ